MGPRRVLVSENIYTLKLARRGHRIPKVRHSHMFLIRHAGAIFMGPYSSEALGDYCAGPNHVLPTSRTARFSSPLGVYDFQKRSSLIHISKAGAQTLGPVAATLATGEGLHAHAASAAYRLNSSNN